MLSIAEFKKRQIVFVITSEGDKLSFSNDNIVIKDKEGKIKHQSTCYKLFMVVIIGEISITSGILQRSKRFGFSICLMTRNMKVYQMINNMGEGNTLLRKKQYQYESIELAQHIVANKIVNQREAIKKKRNKTYFDKEAIFLLGNHIEKLNTAKSQNEIMGLEGSAAKIYFPAFFDNVSWNGRKPRIKHDYINATMDIGYNILFNFMDAVVAMYGFDTYQGVLHSCFYMRKSLVCDFMEPFRPLIDMAIRKAINLGQINEEDFELINKQYMLSWKKSPKYIGIFGNTIIDNKLEIVKYVQEFYRAFMKEKPPDEFPIVKI